MTRSEARDCASSNLCTLQNILEDEVRDYVVNSRFLDFAIFGRTKGRATSLLVDKFTSEGCETTVFRLYADGRVKEFTKDGRLLGEPIVNRSKIAFFLHRYQSAYKLYKSL